MAETQAEIQTEIQMGTDLGERLFRGLSRAAGEHACVAAVGSDLPLLRSGQVERAFERLERGAQVVLGPAEDGGYYLIAVRAEALQPGLFDGIPWSTERVLAETLKRCRALGLATELLAPARDVDTPADLAALAGELAAVPDRCPRTRSLLTRWGRLPAGGEA